MRFLPIALLSGLLLIPFSWGDRTGSAAPPQRDTLVVHVFVALCDNRNQGIIPVPAALGNGQDPEKNLYWGAMYGVRGFLSRSSDWKAVDASPSKPAGAGELSEAATSRPSGSAVDRVAAPTLDAGAED